MVSGYIQDIFRRQNQQDSGFKSMSLRTEPGKTPRIWTEKPERQSCHYTEIRKSIERIGVNSWI